MQGKFPVFLFRMRSGAIAGRSILVSVLKCANEIGWWSPGRKESSRGQARSAPPPVKRNSARAPAGAKGFYPAVLSVAPCDPSPTRAWRRYFAAADPSFTVVAPARYMLLKRNLKAPCGCARKVSSGPNSTTRPAPIGASRAAMPPFR